MIVELADRLKGVKPYYFVKKLDQIRRMVMEGKDVINFGIGSPDLPPVKKAIDKMAEVASLESSHGYQPYAGTPDLRESIASWYESTYSAKVDHMHEVLPLMGSKEGILHTTLAFVNVGDLVLAPNPGYPTYTSLSKLLGAELAYYNLNEETGWYPDFEEIEKTVDLSRVKIMWINYPHMPTGTPATLEIFEQAVAFAKKHKILLCHDNPYSLVLNKKQPISILNVEGAKDVAIEFNSFSKSHNMAGWRVGMVVGKEDYLSSILRVKSNIDSGMFLGTQHAAIEALSVEEQWHTERNEFYASRRKVVWEILDKLGFEYSKEQEGMFVWAKPKSDSGITDITAFIDATLEEKNIFFTPGMIFGSNGEGYIRLSLCVNEERMRQALARL